MEIGKVTAVPAGQRTAAVQALDSTGFSPLRSGLGVPAGEYIFTSADADAIHAVKPIQTAKGKFGLTLVAGTLKGTGDNASVSNVYGFGASDKQMVVTLDQWNGIERNQTYNVTVDANGRAKEIKLASGDSLSVAPPAQPAPFQL